MQIKQKFTVDTSADKVWEILGHNFGSVSDWASGVYASQGRNSGVALQNAPYSGRICETTVGPFDETLTRYDERNKVISYTAQGEKMPFFVKQLANTWTVTPLGNSKCQVEMCMQASLLPVFNILMGPMMRMQFSTLLKETTEELKYFAENGVPHTRKIEAQQKYQLKSA